MFSTAIRRYSRERITFTPKNYFGNGSDGVNTTGSNFTPNAFGDAKVFNFTSMDLGEAFGIGPNAACSGLIIYCQGDCIISGSISMKGKSYVGTGSNNIEIYRIDPISGSEQASSSIMLGLGTDAVNAEANQRYVWATVGDKRVITLNGGAAGAAGVNVSPFAGGSGSASSISTGGGGGGGYYDSLYPANAGVAGKYSGGGKGGRGSAINGNYRDNGGNGGGNIVMIVGGNLIITNTGQIIADGDDGTNGTNPPSSIGGGGGGGGGTISLFYAGSYTNNGIVRANGGSGGSGLGSGFAGGPGGSGSIFIQKISGP
jgi:hypothetical protein